MKVFRIYDNNKVEYAEFNSVYNTNVWLPINLIETYVKTINGEDTDVYPSFAKLEEGVYKPDFDAIAQDEIDSAQAEFRATRDRYLAKCDFAINKALDNGQDAVELRVLRQALRDATIDWVIPDVSLLG